MQLKVTASLPIASELAGSNAMQADELKQNLEAHS